MFRFDRAVKQLAAFTALIIALSVFPSTASALSFGSPAKQTPEMVMFTQTGAGGKYDLYLGEPNQCISIESGLSRDNLYM